MTSGLHGDKAEKRARDVAARLGVPDFVYGQPLVRKGNAVREVGDGLLVVGHRGAVIQVKSREPEKGVLDSPEKALKWLMKNFKSAVRQGSGSLRTITQFRVEGKPLEAIPVRALDFPLEGQSKFNLELSIDCRNWPTVVILDHPESPDVEIEMPDGVFAITLEDWDYLYSRIPSVSGVLDYIECVRVFNFKTFIGQERRRFSAVLNFLTPQLDKNRPFDPLPRFSTAAAQSPEDVAVFRELITRMWEGLPEGPELSAEGIRDVTAFLDSATASQMVYIGKWIQRKNNNYMAGESISSGSVVFDGKLLVYAISSSADWPNLDSWRHELMALSLVRMKNWAEAWGDSDQEVLAVGVRQFEDRREYTHIWMRGLSEVPKETQSYIEWNYGVANFRHGHICMPKISRNEPCPCGSGKKYKRCHAKSPMEMNNPDALEVAE